MITQLYQKICIKIVPQIRISHISFGGSAKLPYLLSLENLEKTCKITGQTINFHLPSHSCTLWFPTPVLVALKASLCPHCFDILKGKSTTKPLDRENLLQLTLHSVSFWTPDTILLHTQKSSQPQRKPRFLGTQWHPPHYSSCLLLRDTQLVMKNQKTDLFLHLTEELV